MKSRYIENDYVEIWWENGLIYEIYKPQVILDIEAAKVIVQDRLMVSERKICPIYVDLRNMVYTDNQTRQYMASEEAQECISAGAILYNNYSQRLILKLCLTVDNPMIPAKMFTDEEEALNWLEQFKFLS